MGCTQRIAMQQWKCCNSSFSLLFTACALGIRCDAAEVCINTCVLRGRSNVEILALVMLQGWKKSSGFHTDGLEEESSLGGSYGDQWRWVWPRHQTWERAAELVPACPAPLACPSSSVAWAAACAGEGLACRWRLMKGNTLRGRRESKEKHNVRELIYQSKREVKVAIHVKCYLFFVSWGTIALASMFLYRSDLRYLG